MKGELLLEGGRQGTGNQEQERGEERMRLVYLQVRGKPTGGGLSSRQD